ncbi:MAG: transketolase C-terminal domain-containing protein, partial [Oscillospiraceae bacterium]|nr:transketolase C-terminal domain-containing protein [Oscillospiraceae bacterium]
YDQMIHDVALDELHVVLGVDRAGLVGADGETHHGCFDALFLPQIPGMTVLCPASFSELRTMLRQAVLERKGPVAVRYPRGGQGRFQEDRSQEPIVRLREGSDVTLLSYGVLINNVLEAAEMLAGHGIEAQVLKLNQIAPLDEDFLLEAIHQTKRLLVLEDAFGVGCVGQRVAAILAQNGVALQGLILKNLGRTFVPQGSVAQLQKSCGLDAESVVQAVLEACG